MSLEYPKVTHSNGDGPTLTLDGFACVDARQATVTLDEILRSQYGITTGFSVLTEAPLK